MNTSEIRLTCTSYDDSRWTLLFCEQLYMGWWLADKRDPVLSYRLRVAV